MELCKESLLARITKSKNFSDQIAADLMFKLLKGLQHVHSSNIIHRDIKPENIMFGDDDEIKYIDFGTAAVATDKQLGFAGTPYYMAPEMFTANVTKECDIWSLGVVLF